MCDSGGFVDGWCRVGCFGFGVFNECGSMGVRDGGVGVEVERGDEVSRGDGGCYGEGCYCVEILCYLFIVNLF